MLDGEEWELRVVLRVVDTRFSDIRDPYLDSYESFCDSEVLRAMDTDNRVPHIIHSRDLELRVMDTRVLYKI